MKNFKRIIALMLSVVLVAACFVGCSKNKEEINSDLAKIKSNGKLVVGITEFEPMDYKEKGSDEWIGFDADMAKAFGEYLGVDVEFVEIEWDNKVFELNNGTIDCVWNGMTLTPEVTEAMSCSKAYCNNAQVVIVNKDVADKYKTAEDCKELKFAVESGSAGEAEAKANGYEYTPVKDQPTALFEVQSGTSDAAIIDSLMAAAMVGEGTSYENLTYTAALNSEEYGVGFRKGSDVVDEFNKFLAASIKDGSMEKCAEKYGVQAAVIKE